MLGLYHVCNATQVSHTSNSIVNNSDNVVNTNHDNSVIMSSASNSSVLGGVLSNSGSLLNPVFVPTCRPSVVNGWRLAKMKKSIPDMSLPLNL